MSALGEVPVRYFGDNNAAERILNQEAVQLAYMKRSHSPKHGVTFHENRERLGVFLVKVS